MAAHGHATMKMSSHDIYRAPRPIVMVDRSSDCSRQSLMNAPPVPAEHADRGNHRRLQRREVTTINGQYSNTNDPITFTTASLLSTHSAQQPLNTHSPSVATRGPTLVTSSRTRPPATDMFTNDQPRCMNRSLLHFIHSNFILLLHTTSFNSLHLFTASHIDSANAQT